MFRKPFIAWFTGLACLLLAGCGGASVAILFFGDFPQDHVQVVPFQKIVPAFDSAIGEPRRVVIRDLVAWDALWREHAAGISPPPPMPAINFSQDMVIGVFLGSRGNDCHDVEIQSILEHTNPNHIEVNFHDIRSTINAPCNADFRHAAALVVLKQSFLPVNFFEIN